MKHNHNPFSKFTIHAKNILEKAMVIAQKEKTKHITSAQLLRALFEEKGSLAYNILILNKANPLKMSKSILKNAKIQRNIKKKQVLTALKTEYDKTVKNIIKKSISTAAFYGHPYIGTEHILFSIIQCSSEFTANKKRGKIIKQLKEILSASTHFHQLSHIQNIKQHTHKTYPKQKKEQRETPNTPYYKMIEKQFPVLSFFCENLTHKERTQHMLPFFGREKELERITYTLLRKSKNNPLLIGEAGIGKTAIVNALAKKITSGDIAYTLRDKQIFSLDVGELVAGSAFRGEFEARIKDIIEEAKHSEVILFIDEIHTIIGAGNTSGSLDVANILKPVLIQSGISLISATTPDEYKKTIEKDAALARRFQQIFIREESEQNIFSLLSYAKHAYEDHHEISISKEAIQSAITYSQRFITHRRLPDKAFDILDEAAARLRSKRTPPHTEKAFLEIERDLQKTQHEKNTSIHTAHYKKGIELKQKEIELLGNWEMLKVNTKQPTNTRPVLTDIHIKDTMADMLGITSIDGASDTNIKKILHKNIVGQAHIIEKITQTITRQKAGLCEPNRPLASFLFLGPSGVGKTQTAKTLANAIFGTHTNPDKTFNNFIKIDMSEFSESHSISRLIGAPPGYVGFEEGGMLAQKVKQNPYSIVLFDEIEKAHPQIFNIFLQILDEGIFTDSFSDQISLKNTIIIFTSNIGTEEFNKQSMGFTSMSSQKTLHAFTTIKENVLGQLKNIMRPELLARIDNILTFMPLNDTAMKKIATIQIDSLSKKLRTEKNITLSYSKSVTDNVIKKSKNNNEGARLIKRNIAQYIEYPIASLIVKGNVRKGGYIHMKGETNGDITIRSTKK